MMELSRTINDITQNHEVKDEARTAKMMGNCEDKDFKLQMTMHREA
jgi:hypothetical protein